METEESGLSGIVDFSDWLGWTMRDVNNKQLHLSYLTQFMWNKINLWLRLIQTYLLCGPELGALSLIKENYCFKSAITMLLKNNRN